MHLNAMAGLQSECHDASCMPVQRLPCAPLLPISSPYPSPTPSRFLERMAAELARKAGQEARLLGAVKEVEARRHEAKAQLVSIAPKVCLLSMMVNTGAWGPPVIYRAVGTSPIGKPVTCLVLSRCTTNLQQFFRNPTKLSELGATVAML